MRPVAVGACQGAATLRLVQTTPTEERETNLAVHLEISRQQMALLT